ncbi:uroplakin-2 [Pelodytes ibericus]
MHLLGIVTALVFISTVAGVDTNITSLSSYVIASVRAKSAIIAFPPGCTYSGMQATLNVLQTDNNTVSQALTFTVPQCRMRRDLVVINNTVSGNTQTINVGYQVTNLLPSTSYTAYYSIGSAQLVSTTFKTNSGNSAPATIFARSGGMVVITVLLSIAMFLLVVLLIVTLVLKGGGKK